MILVVRDGELVEQGRHQALMDKQGDYYRLCRQQFSDQLEPDA
jgi:ABC-type multidrug transport system fused ATPase/permease subunit